MNKEEKIKKLQELKDNLFTDFFNDFEVNPMSKDIMIAKNENAIKQSLKNIVMTNFGERFFNPYFGNRLKRSLFEFNDPITILNIKDAIQECILQFEPRANLIDIKFSQEFDSNELKIDIVFSVINNNNIFSVPITLKRIR